MIKYIMLSVVSGIMASFSQILLKKSAGKKKDTILGEYLNRYVVTGYAIMAVSMILTVIVYRGIPFKYGAVLESLAYLYIMILSRVFLREKITRKKVIGNLMIAAGVIIFSI